MKRVQYAGIVLMAFFVAGLGLPRTSYGHCDAMDGPVVIEAMAALKSGELDPVLKWVSAEDEPDVCDLFVQVRGVRDQDEQVRELTDRYFLETVVRLHRASEGAPYTGLKPAGAGHEPAVVAVDRALDTGSAEPVFALISNELTAGIEHRFERAKEAARHAEHSIEAGRAYVHAYVELVHYVKHVHRTLTDAASTEAAQQHDHGH